MKILYLSKFDLPDFQCDCIFHGLRSFLGEDIIDANEAWYMYDDFRNYWADRVPSRGMEYGRGFTLYGKLPKLNIDRSDILSKIKNHYFDKIIFGSIIRYKEYLKDVCDHYNDKDIIFIDGEDFTNLTTYPWNSIEMNEWEYYVRNRGIYYKRESYAPSWMIKNVKPLNFCIPKELIVKEIPKKEKDYATIIPGDKSTYIYTEEKPYYEDYQKSYFGITCKKGGWDCLRHYEILMNGCIPIFPDLEQCPEMTMRRFPKKLVIEAYNKIKEGNDLSFYEEYVNLLLDHTRKYLTTESMAKEIIS